MTSGSFHKYPWFTVKSLGGSLPLHVEAHPCRTHWLMPLWGITDARCITKFHDERLVKTKGVTLVALATLLAGFVASCFPQNYLLPKIFRLTAIRLLSNPTNRLKSRLALPSLR